MSWAVQHMRVTLEDAETGEVVVIEEGQARKAKEEAKAKEAKAKEEAREKEAKAKAKAKEEARAKEEKAKEEKAKEAKAKEDRAKEAKAKEAKAKEAKEGSGEERTAPPKSKPRSPKSRPLAWRAVKDNNYDGFAAKVRLGEFKALHARNTQWALFFERKDTYPAHLGCFRKIEQAKARAQELSDAGWPENEFGDVTREMVERACPVPGAAREEKPEMGRQEPEKPATPPRAEETAEMTEDKPAPPTPSPEGGSTDERLTRSFMNAVRSLADEDEDDD